MEAARDRATRRVAPVQRALLVAAASPARVQRSATLRVSSPGDLAEREAEATAKRVMQMPVPSPAAAPPTAASPPGVGRSLAATGTHAVARAGTGTPDTSPEVAAAIRANMTGGALLPDEVRRGMEFRFRADFGRVRVHTGEEPARLASRLSARAFTVGSHIFFGRGQFQPESSDGQELIAHELTHTIQQGGAVQRAAEPLVVQRAEPHVQRGIIGEVLDYFADKAYHIPGYRMFTFLIGVNPINMSRVARTPANFLRALIELLPGGHVITQALDSHGVIDKAAAVVDKKVNELGLTASAIKQSIDDFIDSLGWRDVFRLGSVWNRAKRIFLGPIEKIIELGTSMLGVLLDLVKQAILRPLARLAEGTRAYDLLKAVLGEDPITGDKVPRTAEALIGGFMKLIGQEEIWENIKKSKAIARAWAWFQNALTTLFTLLTSIPGRFISALKSLTFTDVVLVVGAFKRVGGVFLSVFSDCFGWAGTTIWNLLEIIFDVVAPAVMPYLRKAAAAFRTILKDPIGFARNLIAAAKRGFDQFAERILTHLKEALVSWLTGALGGAGVYIPKALEFSELLKLALSVLGLTWQNIREKLVKATSEEVVQGLEKGFGIVVTLVRDGPAAAWEQIKLEIADLKERAIKEIQDWVVVTVVKKAVVKLLSLLSPVGAFIQSVLAIWDTVTFVIDKIKQIAAVGKAVIDSIIAIANGVIQPAADRVERTLAGLLTLAIAFLAQFAGLGKAADKVKEILQKIRAPIEKGLDRVVSFVVEMAKKAGRFVAAKGQAAVGAAKEKAAELFSWAFAKRTFSENGTAHSITVEGGDAPRLMIASTPRAAKEFLSWYVSSQKAGFKAKKAKQIEAVETAIAASERIAKAIAALKKGGGAWKSKQGELLDANITLSGAIATLVGDDRDIAGAIEKYKLEGMTGTYGSIPKPVGDDFTADHQPQAAILVAAAKFKYFTKTGELHERAEGRAAAGYAINLHKTRHAAGATYGSKGKTTKEEFLAAVRPAVKDLPAEEQRAAVIALIRKDLRRDVAAMKSVVRANHKSPIWEDVVDMARSEEAGKKVVSDVRSRILAGEDQIANQELGST